MTSALHKTCSQIDRMALEKTLPTATDLLLAVSLAETIAAISDRIEKEHFIKLVGVAAILLRRHQVEALGIAQTPARPTH